MSNNHGVFVPVPEKSKSDFKHFIKLSVSVGSIIYYLLFIVLAFCCYVQSCKMQSQ